VTVKFEELDDLAVRYLKTLSFAEADYVEVRPGDGVIEVFSPGEVAEMVLRYGADYGMDWYGVPSFIEWVKQDVLGEQERRGRDGNGG